jgi:predicted amidohydrolase
MAALLGKVSAEQTAAPGAAEPAGRKLKIAAIALATLDGVLESNYARAVRMAEISLQYKPDIILLPEAFAGGYCGRPLVEFAEDESKSEHLAKFRRLSARGHSMIVLGYLEKVEGDRRVRNAVAIYDGGRLVGRHYKHNLWPDVRRPYRDEPSQMIAGKEIEIFRTRLGRFAVLICYENSFRANWDALRGKVDFVLSPYNCQGDSSHHNVANARRLGIPSAWADRTGTVYCGDGRYMMNAGTAGLVDAKGKTIIHSRPGTERIVVGELEIGNSAPRPTTSS